MSSAFPATQNLAKQDQPINVDLLFKLTQFEMQLPAFLDDRGRQIAENALDEIKKKMQAANYSRKIIEGTTLSNFEITSDGFLEFEITSEYDSESGFDVATAREKGTTDHDLPKVEGRTYSWIQDGKRFFSKGHRVSAIPASNIITDTLLQTSVKLQNNMNSAIDSFFEGVVNQ